MAKLNKQQITAVASKIRATISEENGDRYKRERNELVNSDRCKNAITTIETVIKSVLGDKALTYFSVESGVHSFLVSEQWASSPNMIYNNYYSPYKTPHIDEIVNDLLIASIDSSDFNFDELLEKYRQQVNN